MPVASTPRRQYRLGLSSTNAELTDSPERSHGDDGVPECLRDAGEFRLGDVLLGVEHDRRKDDDRHRQREEQEAELTGTRPQRVAKDPQTTKPLTFSLVLRTNIIVYVSNK